MEENRLVIVPQRRARQGWKEKFATAGSSADDALPLELLPANKFDDEEWTW